MDINIVLMGAVSTGKSTFLNALFAEQFSDMGIKRTTMVPLVYRETDTSFNPKDILNTNKILNQRLNKTTEQGHKLSDCDIKENVYDVNRLFDLVELRPEIHLSIYDTPGLNDSSTKRIHFKYVKENFYKFDIVILMIDVMSAFNTSDEIEILELILENIWKNKLTYDVATHLMILVNKCDDLSVNENSLVFEEEIAKMFEQAKNIISRKINEYNTKNQKQDSYSIPWKIMPMASEASFIYRMFQKNPQAELDTKHLNKFGHNEYGKVQWDSFSEIEKKHKVQETIRLDRYQQRLNATGFNHFKTKLQEVLSDSNQYLFLGNHIIYDMYQYNKKHLQIRTMINLGDVCKMNEFRQHINKLDSLFNISLEQSMIEAFNSFMTNYFESCHIIILSNLTTEISSLEMYRRYLIFKNFCDMISADFPDTYTIYIDLHKQITSTINKYHLMKIAAEKTASDKLEHVDELIENGHTEWKYLLIECVNSIDVIKLPTPDQVKLIENIKEKYYLDTQEVVNLTFNLMDTIYAHDVSQITCHAEYNIKYAMITKFWNNLIVKTTNPYSNHIFFIKQLFNYSFEYTTPNISDKKYNELEEYLYAHLKSIFPKEIYSIDDILEIAS